MFIQQSFLRLVRKRTELTQIDIASILKISDFANVSRWEQGLKIPSIEILLSYHLLFNIPIESIFEKQKQALQKTIIPRIQAHIAYLKTLGNNAKIQSRINYLGSILNRLAL
jgi:transcriptional regulator with XRE-family HTH domain